MDCNLPGSSVHGIFQARVLEWVAISFSRGSSRPRDQTQVSHIAGRRFTISVTKVAPWCPTLCNPMDYRVHGILQARILEWVAFPFSRGSSQPRNQTQVSHAAGRFFISWATGTHTHIYVVLLFNHSVVSDSLWPCGLQHRRLPCPSPPSRACSNSCPLSQWCHPTVLSSVVPFSSCLPSFPGSGSFPMSRFFASGGQSTRASASASVLPMNIQGWFPLGLTGFISLQFKGLLIVFSNTTVQKHQFFSTQHSLRSNSHICTWLLEKQ